jgi:acyl carrier protein
MPPVAVEADDMERRLATIKTQVRGFVVTNFYFPDASGVADAASLLEAGVVDSTGILEVIAFLASAFGVAVEDDEIVPENLDTIERIATYVVRKTAAV